MSSGERLCVRLRACVSPVPTMTAASLYETLKRHFGSYLLDIFQSHEFYFTPMDHAKIFYFIYLF